MNYILQFVLILIGAVSSRADIWLDPDTGLNLYQFIAKYGYYYENYTVTTDDGYILNTVRIPRGLNESASNSSSTKKPAVLILHGLFSNPTDFLIFGEDSLGFLMANNGFDVFLMTSRGTTYSGGHVSLSTDSVEYWNFSWNELGYYDIPANIDLIADVTGSENITYVGHSQGGTSFLVMAATRPEYRARISLAHLFGPVVYTDNTRVPFIQVLIQNEEYVEDIVADLQLSKNGFLTYSPLIGILSDLFCSRDSLTVELCVDFIGELVGPDPDQINRTKITVLTSNDPAGGSFNEVFHYLQVSKTSAFRKFDYRSLNMEVYNQSEPPMYNLSSITDVPIYIWYGYNDYFSGVLDSLRLIDEIPSAIGKPVANLLWNHFDFTFAKDVRTYLNDPVLEITLDSV